MLWVITSYGASGGVKRNVMGLNMSEMATRKAAYHHGDLREALIAAATAEVEEKGHEAVSLSALARRLGVSQAAPYRHFPDRDALLSAVATQAFRTAGAELREAVGSRPTLGQIAHAYLAFGLGHPRLYGLMYGSRLLQRSSVGGDLYTAADANFDLTLEAVDPTLPDLTRRRFALKFWTSLHGIVTLAEHGLIPPKIRQISVAELIDELVHDTELAIAAATRANH